LEHGRPNGKKAWSGPATCASNYDCGAAWLFKRVRPSRIAFVAFSVGAASRAVVFMFILIPPIQGSLKAANIALPPRPAQARASAEIM